MSAASRYWPGVCLGPLAALMLWWTWGTWPDPLIDFGRELYVPWQLSLGRVLYVDVLSFNGPLSPYVNAAWFRLAGVSLQSLAALNIAVAALLAWLIFHIVGAIAARAAATLACGLFFVLFAFAQYTDVGNYNFVTPYSHELTHGVALAFGALYSLWRYLRAGGLSALAATGALLALVFLTKAEVFLAAATAVAVGLGLARWQRVQPIGARAAAALAAGLLAVLVLAFVLLGAVMPVAEAWRAVAGAWRYVFDRGLAGLAFYRSLSGLDDPVASLRTMLAGFAVYVLVFGWAGVTALAVRRHRYGLEVCAPAGLLILLGFALLPGGLRLDHVARPFPILLTGCGALAIERLVQASSQHDRARATLQGAVVVFSLVLLGKVALNARLYHYGFALAMPAALVVTTALIDWLPRRIGAAGGSATLFRTTALLAIGIVTARYVATGVGHRLERRVEVGAGRDQFLADARGEPVAAAVREINARTRPGATLVVVPEGVMLNYLTRRTSPVPYVSFLPPELAMFGADRAFGSIRASAPDYVAVVDRPLGEYGLRGLDDLDDGRLTQWLSEHYEEVVHIPGAPGAASRFGIRLLRRASGSPRTHP